MSDSRTFTARNLGVSTLLLSPLVVILSIPLAIGVGLDIFGRFGEAPYALLLCAPLAFVLLRRVSPVAHDPRPELHPRLHSTIRAH